MRRLGRRPFNWRRRCFSPQFSSRTVIIRNHVSSCEYMWRSCGTDNTDTGLVPLPQNPSDQSVGIALQIIYMIYMFVLWGICQQLDHMHPYASVCCNSPRAADDMIPRLPQLLEKFLWSQWASMAEAARLAVHDSPASSRCVDAKGTQGGFD